MENHDNDHNLSWQIFHTVQRYDNNGKTFEEHKCINNRLFPFCDQMSRSPLNSCFLFLSHNIWQSNNIIVKIYVANAIKQALIEYLREIVHSFAENEETFAFNVERCSCVPVKGCHQEHVAHNNHHHGVELTIAKAVSKKDKDEKS